jgi:hypothetical protein
MARPERNTVDYFPHLLGEGKKMYFIENKYGNNGYATWYKILEKLGATEYHYLNLNKEEEVMFLASKCKISEELLISIINDLSKMDVFHKELWSNKIVWCPQFIESIEDAYKKRNNKCISLDGLRILLDSLGVLKLSKCITKGVGNTQSKEEERKEKKNIIIPSESEFFEYCKTIKEFPFSEYEYSIKSKYESWVANGWKDGHNAEIKNWKSKIKNTLPHLKPIKAESKKQTTAPDYQAFING